MAHTHTHTHTRRDPEGAVLAFCDMMKKGIVMPAHLVEDGVHAANNNGASLFMDYATVADSTGVYTTSDYAAIVDHLVSGPEPGDGHKEGKTKYPAFCFLSISVTMWENCLSPYLLLMRIPWQAHLAVE